MPGFCVVCDSRHHKTIFDEFGVAVARCLDCGHVYSTHALPPDYAAYWDKMLIEGETQYWFSDAHKAIYDDFIRRFLCGRSGRLLDVGAGLGYFVREVARQPDWEAHGCEISPRAVAFAKEQLGLANMYCGRVEDPGFKFRDFDIVTLWDVIEHLTDPRALLTYLRAALKPDGFLFVHTPNIWMQLPKVRLKKLVLGMRQGSHYLEAKDHMNIYSPVSLKRLLTRMGFAQVGYCHLRPVQGVAGSKNSALVAGKNAWFLAAKLVDAASFGRCNLDNLSAVARR